MTLTRGGFLTSVGGLVLVAAGRPAFGHDRPQVSPGTGVPAQSTRITGVELLPFTIAKKVPQRNALGVVASSDGVFGPASSRSASSSASSRSPTGTGRT
jgi:hypothetical protein